MSPTTQIPSTAQNESGAESASTRPIASDGESNSLRSTESDARSAHSDCNDHSRHLDALRALPEVRVSKVEAARRAIASGEFNDTDRLDRAVSRMIEELRSE
ncbi:MAG: hypothetical protein EXS00_03620 [Phycisphaerales bacterium]|nr:hypothetical protein [Phycisphaerales bacterium]